MLRRLMARFGPIHPGQTGHPMAGQTVEVQANFGGPDGGVHRQRPPDHGNAVIPRADADGHPSGDVRQLLPCCPSSTALTFPCSGSGSVAFRPVHGGSGARPAVVKASFASGD
jgi:hypothetical protein